MSLPDRPPRDFPQAVLLDLDDTLYDHALTCRAAIGGVRRRSPALRGVPVDELWAGYLGSFDSTHAAVLRRELTGREAREARWRSLLSRYGPAPTSREVTEISDRYRDEYLELQRPVPGAIALVRRLHRRAVVVVVTNNELEEQERKLAFLGVRAWIDHLVVSAQVGVVKPDPAIFRVALRRARTGPREAVMLGDSWESDIVGARAAGIPAVWFNRFHRPRPRGPRVAEIDSLRPATAVERVLAAAFFAGRSARIISSPPVRRR